MLDSSRRRLSIIADRYALDGALGRGASGAVFRARDLRRGGCEVAVKVLTKLDEKARARFERERAAAGRLSHPGLAALLDHGVHGEVPFLVWELVPGQPLSAALAAADALPPSRAAEVVRDIALALDHAHRQGVVHRDLKPANVILRPDGRPVVVDLGLVAVEGAARLTRTGASLGTPLYMAPEQVVGGTTDARTDVYALGALLFELLAGRAPHEDVPASDLPAAIVRAPVLVPSAICARPVPLELDAACLRCLAKAPDERFQTAEEVAAALDRFLEGSGPPAVQRRRRPAALVATALALLGGLGAWAARRAAPEAPAPSRGFDAQGPSRGSGAPEAPRPEVGSARPAAPQDEAVAAALAGAPAEEVRRLFARAVATAGRSGPAAAEVARQAALALYHRAEYEEALAAIQGTALGPVTPADRLLEGLANLAMDAAQGAARLERLHDEDPDGAAGLAAGARVARLRGNLRLAESLARRSLELDPEGPGRVELGRVLSYLQRSSEALPLLEAALARRPDDAGALSALGHAVAADAIDGAPRGDVAERALRALDQVLVLHGGRTDLEVHQDRAVLLAALGRAGAARAAFHEAPLANLDASGHVNHVIVAHKLGLLGDARILALRALRLAPERVRRIFERCPPELRALFEEEEAAPRPGSLSPELRARLSWRVRRADPRARQPLLRALEVLAEGGPWPAPAWEEALREGAACRVTAVEHARALVGRDRYTEAPAALERARSLGVTGPDLDRLAAELAWRQGDPGVGVLLEALAAADPRGAEGRCAAAAAAWLEQDPARVEEQALAALAVEPEHAPSLALLATGLLALDRLDEARLAADMALALDGASSTLVLVADATCAAREALEGRRPMAEALAHVNSVMRLTPAAHVRCTAANLALSTGAPTLRPLAARWLEEARRAEPDRGDVYLLLGIAALQDGRDDDQTVRALWERGRSCDRYRSVFLDLYARRFGAAAASELR